MVTSRYRSGAKAEKVVKLHRLVPESACGLFLDLARRGQGDLKETDGELDKILKFLDGVLRAILQAAKQDEVGQFALAARRP